MATLEAVPASLRTTELDEMWSFLDARYYRSRLRLTDPAERLDAHLQVVQLGPVTLGSTRFGAGIDVFIADVDAYHVNLLAAGRLRCRRTSHDPLVVTPEHAVLYPPDSSIDDRTSADCVLLNLRIEPAALRDQLARMLDAPVPSAPRLGERIAITRGVGLSWARLVRVLAADALQPQGLARHSLMRDRYVESLLSGLLMSSEHRYRDALAVAPRRDTAPRAVRRVRDVIEAHPDTPFTLAALAEVAGVGPRALQVAFQRHVGTSPMAYLRDVRLARAHRDLCAPDAPTVAAVASAWGFHHLGRFAALYRARYGVHPSRSLRSGR